MRKLWTPLLTSLALALALVASVATPAEAGHSLKARHAVGTASINVCNHGASC